MSNEVQSLLRGLSLLEALAEADTRGATLQDLAEKTGLSPSTAHRLLSTFVEADYVTRGTARHSYVLGHRIIGIAGSVQLRTAHLRVIARPHLEDLAEECGETVNLVALDGRSSVYIDQAEGSRLLQMSIRIGSVFPAYTSASAKAILAFQKCDDALHQIFGDGRIKRFTRRTIVDVEAFRKELQITRERGYAIEREEVDVGISCIAAPILDRKSMAVAAISVPGPTARVLNPTPERLGNLIMAHTAKISKALSARSYARPSN